MNATIHHSDDFEVAEQVDRRSHLLHIFESRAQFNDWRAKNQSLKLVSPKQARGRRELAVDHRGDYIQ